MRLWNPASTSIDSKAFFGIYRGLSIPGERNTSLSIEYFYSTNGVVDDPNITITDEDIPNRVQ